MGNSAAAPRVNIGEVLRNAAVFDFSRHRNREDFMSSANIPADAEAFFDLLQRRSPDYLLVGGVAMLAHIRGRNTEDINLVISTRDQHRLEPEVQVLEREGFFARAQFKRLRIDFLAAEHSLFAHVSARCADERTFDFLSTPHVIRCATPEGLMLLKLYALPSLYRQGQIERARIYEGDIGALLLAFPDLDAEGMLDLLQQHGLSATDAAELRKIVDEQRPRPRAF